MEKNGRVAKKLSLKGISLVNDFVNRKYWLYLTKPRLKQSKGKEINLKNGTISFDVKF